MKDSPLAPGEVSHKRALEMLAARGDAVTQSALSRYVSKYADELRPRWRGKERVIDFERLWKHRRENIRLPDPVDAAVAAPKSDVAIVRSEAATANVRAQRQLREHDLTHRIAKLTPRVEVIEAAERGIAMMRRAVEQAADEVAGSMAEALGADAALIRPHLLARGMRAVGAMQKVFVDHGFTREAAHVEE